MTLTGLKHNIKVGILFVEAWLRGQGHFLLDGAVEDSATAEISRSQVFKLSSSLYAKCSLYNIFFILG